MQLAHTLGMQPPKKIKNSDADLTFWERLQKASAWAEISCTPKEVATELGIRPSAVTKYVNGKFPKKENLNRLAKRRHVRSEWLLSGFGEMVAEDALDADTLELLRLWRNLDPSAKERLMANLRYEYTAQAANDTGKRNALTEQLIALLAAQGHLPKQ